MIAVLAWSGPTSDAGTVIMLVDVSIATTGVSACEYAVFNTLACERNGAAACELSG